jgi:dynein assembly factor 3, axonemal
MCERQLSMRER